MIKLSPIYVFEYVLAENNWIVCFFLGPIESQNQIFNEPQNTLLVYMSTAYLLKERSKSFLSSESLVSLATSSFLLFSNFLA